MKGKFQQVFLTVLFLTLVSGITSLYIAQNKTLSEEQKRIFETTTITWNIGVGTIFGLLGGKATINR